MIQQLASHMAEKSSALSISHALPPERSGTQPPGATVQSEGSRKLQKSNELIWTRIRDLLAFSTAPQPSTLMLLHTSFHQVFLSKFYMHFTSFPYVLHALPISISVISLL
jgi:hypothetical protein